MKYPTMRFVYDKNKVGTMEKPAMVFIEVLSERKRKWIGTPVKVYPNQWHKQKKVVRHIDSSRLNTMLDALMSQLNDFITDLIRKGIPFDFEKLNAFLEKKDKSVSFIEFVRERVEGRNDITGSTKKQHRALIKSLETFGGIITTNDLTKQNISKYYDWLHTVGIAQPTIHNYIKRMKVYINQAITAGLIDTDPTRGMHFDRGKSEKRKYLTPEELGQIERCDIPNAAISRVRDLFLFQAYTGLAYADLAKFDFRKDTEERDGKYIIADRRQKSNEDFFIVLLSPAVRILRKYNYTLPVISNQKYNMELKVLAQYARIDKSLTTHMARHTFAVFALNNGAPMEAVSKMLGHTNIKTTQIYARVLNKEVERVFDMLENKLK